jgi:hypothetical protein
MNIKINCNFKEFNLSAKFSTPILLDRIMRNFNINFQKHFKF